MAQDSEHVTPIAGQKPSYTPSDVFHLVWSELVQVLGSSSTAALVRRCAKARIGDYPELQELVVTRTNFDYSYTVPERWKVANDSKALRILLQELEALLTELTGPVVVQRLNTLPGLSEYRLSRKDQV